MRPLALIAALALLPLACKNAADRAPPAAPRHYTYRAIAGISMGGVGSSLIAARHPEKFDAVGLVGGPLDVRYLYGAIERSLAGGFCPLAKLEAAAAADQTRPEGTRASLDTPGALDCGNDPIAPVQQYEHAQFFNHWAFTKSGGTFDRDEYLRIFLDLSLALGNPLASNPDSPALPPGVTRADVYRPDLCANPVRVKNVFNAEYNPQGKYDAITFCDGQAPVVFCSATADCSKEDATEARLDFCAAGVTRDQVYSAAMAAASAYCAAHQKTLCSTDKNFRADLYWTWNGYHDACFPSERPVTFALAVDLNGNGRRDWYEPLIINAHERYQDVGVDGCADALEDGKGGCVTDPSKSAWDAATNPDPNHDDYDPLKNPAGTEGDWIHEEGEPFEDNGLDGVPGTHDEGEGNGKFDESANRAYAASTDLRTQLKGDAWKANLGRVDVYTDGGIRDVFNFGVMGAQVYGALSLATPSTAKLYDDFVSLPDGVMDGAFDPTLVDYAKMGRHPFIRYGNPQADLKAIRLGDGDHVGTQFEVYARFGTFFKWLSHRWDGPLGPEQPEHGTSQPENKTFVSSVLGAPWDYAIAVPPGYDAPANANRRYPVVAFLHGYGQAPDQIVGINIVLQSFANTGDMRGMILVFPSGRCCFTGPNGERDCREVDDAGTNIDQKPGWRRECSAGTFFVNRRGFSANDGTRYEDALFELLADVDKNYRTLAPADK